MAPTARHLRWPRLLFSVLGGLVLLAVIAYVALNQAFPPERLSALLSEQVRKTTGRDFAVRGPLSIRLLPRIGVAAQDVVLGNAPWGTRKDMLRVQHARFDIALWPLLHGLVDIASVSFDGVDLLLETDRNGVGNWAMGRDGDAKASASDGGGGGNAPLRLNLASLSLSNASLAYRDGRSGSVQRLAVPKLQLDADGDGQTLSATLDSGAQRWQLKGRIGAMADLALNQADWPFDLQLAADGASATAKGQLRRGPPPRALEADIGASLSKVTALLPWLPAAARLPLPAELKARLNFAPQSVRLDGLQLSLAQQQLSGQLKAQGGNPWRIDAQLSSPSIDLARWLPPRAAASGTPAPSSDQRVFDDTPLALDALPAGPATLALRVDQLRVPGLPPLSKLNLQLNAQPGRLRLDPLSVGVADGTLRGSLNIVTAAGAAPRVALQAQADKLSMDTLLQASGHSAYASGGQLQLRADLSGAGHTARALASSASGELMLSLTDTTLGSGTSPLGTDLLRRLLQAVSLQTQPVSSHVDCAVIRLPLKNGVATVDRSIALETEQLSLSAKGEVRVDDETLTLAFRPTPKTGLHINPLNLAQLVVLKGPWRDPKVALDAQGVAGVAASVGLAGVTGGLSLLAQQLLQAAPEKDVCRTALSGIAPSPAPTTPATPASQPQTPLKLPQALPEALRNIFK